MDSEKAGPAQPSDPQRVASEDYFESASRHADSYYTADVAAAVAGTSSQPDAMQEGSRKINAVVPVDRTSGAATSSVQAVVDKGEKVKDGKASQPTRRTGVDKVSSDDADQNAPDQSKAKVKKSGSSKEKDKGSDDEPMYTLNPLYYPDGAAGLREPSKDADYESAAEGRQQQPRGSLGYIRRGSQAVAEAGKNFTRRLSASVQNGMGAIGKGLGVSDDEKDINRWKEAKRERARSISGGPLAMVDRAADAVLSALKEAADIGDDTLDEAGGRDVGQINRDFLRDLAAFDPDATGELSKDDVEDEARFNMLQEARLTAASANVEDFALGRAKVAGTDDGPGPDVFCVTPTLRSQVGSVQKLSVDEFSEKFCKSAERSPMTPPPPAGAQASVAGDDAAPVADDDGCSVYENDFDKPPAALSKAGLSADRFVSDTKLSGKQKKHAAGKAPSDEQWDNGEIVADKIQRRQLLKDIKAASGRLLEHADAEATPKFSDILRNPGYNFPPGWEAAPEDDRLLQSFPDGDVPRKPLPEGANPDDFLYGKEAFEHYLRYRKLENEALNEKLAMERLAVKTQLLEKKKRIEEALKLAKEHYCTPYGGRRQSLREKLAKLRSKPDLTSSKPLPADVNEAHVRMQLESLQTFTPWFIYAITVLQVIAISVFCSIGGIATIGLVPKITKQESMMTWQGTVEVVHYDMPNVWIGPTAMKENNMGAMFAPCVREDKLVTLINAKYAAVLSNDLGCCEVAGRGAGTTTRSECESLLGNVTVHYEWRNISCASRSAANVPGGRFIAHTFKPCCYGYKGQCALLSYEHCTFIGGSFYVSTHEHCSQTHCDERMCTMFDSQASSVAPDQELKPHSHNQFWRLPLSLLYHHGIIHAALICTVQVFLGADIERLAGWLRVGLIYVVSGLGGLLVGSTLRPYEPNVGAGGAAFGLVGVTLVELLQSWRLVNKPARPFVKVFSLISLFLFSGFLPQVNQFTQLGGFVFGLVSAAVFLPYVSFELWQARARMVVLVSCSVLLFVLAIAAFFSFYVTQPISIGSLMYLNCMSYIPLSCDDDLP